MGCEKSAPLRWSAVRIECRQKSNADHHGDVVARLRSSDRSGEEGRTVSNSNNETLVQLDLSTNISRRRAMQWVMAAVAASAMPGSSRAQEVGRTPIPQENAATQPVIPTGYGLDAKLVAIHKPGDFWPLTFNDAQRKTVAALADVIIPKDALGPAASEVGVVPMIDEWISAPYPHQQADRRIILEGLVWLEAESNKRFSKPFAQLNDGQKKEICDDICFLPSAKLQFQDGA